MFTLVFSSFSVYAAPKVAGDDPGVTISSPVKVSSGQLVELSVTMASSAGKLDEDGKVIVKVPKNSVKFYGDLVNNLVIGEPFYLKSPTLTEDDENYFLTIYYDHTKIDQQSAIGTTFKIQFKTTVKSENLTETFKFEADLYKNENLLSTDFSNTDLVHKYTPQPVLSKMSTQPFKVINGVKACIMSIIRPDKNVFGIRINHNRTTVKNAVLKDTIQEGTALTDPIVYVPATGDATTIKHFRVAKVTSFNEQGGEQSFEYVTKEFEDKIKITPTGFEIDFGDLTPDDSYVIMYATRLTKDFTPDEYQFKRNTATLYSDGESIRTAVVTTALDNQAYENMKLLKTVSNEGITTTVGNFDYKLELEAINSEIKAGTVIKDDLPEFTKFKETLISNSEYFSDAVYNKINNTVEYTLLKTIKEKDKEAVSFRVSYDNPNSVVGEKILNRASFNYSGSQIYSNEASTISFGSAALTKFGTDQKTLLQGAKFNVVDDSGLVVQKGLVTDSKGEIKTKVLQPGKYKFIEVEAPPGYQVDPTPIPFTVKAGQKDVIKLESVNQKIKKTGGIKVKKVDADDSTIKLAGAEFEVFKSGTPIGKIVTNSKGEGVIENLPFGSYEVIETKAPKGYALNSQLIGVLVEDRGILNITTLEVENEKKLPSNKAGTLKIQKLEKGNLNNQLAGAKFNILDENHKIFMKVMTNEDGEATVSNMPFGKYYVKEIQAPNGYILDDEQINIEIKKQTKPLVIQVLNDKFTGGGENPGGETPGGETPSIDLPNNNASKNSLSKIKIIKHDSKDKSIRLKDAEFILKDQNGKEISKLRTNNYGVAISPKLKYGKYSLEESKAPKGYQISRKKYDVNIDGKLINNEFVIEIGNVKDKGANSGLPQTGFNNAWYLILLGGILILISTYRLKRKNLL